MLVIILIMALICYVAMQFVETVSFGSRVAGKLLNRLSLGTTLQHSIFVASRIFLPPMLLSLSFLIESNLDIKLFLLTATLLTTTAFFTSLLVYFNFNYFQLLFQRIFIKYQSNTIPVSIVKVLFGKNNGLNYVDLEYIPKIKNLSLRKIISSTLAYFFLSTGFLIAFSLAILIPDYRMTMSQTATVFHGIGAVILAMYIDPMISRSLDIELKNFDWIENIYSIFIGRLVAYLLSSFIFLTLFLYMSLD